MRERKLKVERERKLNENLVLTSLQYIMRFLFSRVGGREKRGKRKWAMGREGLEGFFPVCTTRLSMEHWSHSQ